MHGTASAGTPAIQDAPALAVEYRAVADLVPYARNARTHSPEQIDQIAASIQEFGWTNPILVDGANGVVAGHGRLAAAQQLGSERVPVIELAHLSAPQRRAYILADNKLAENAGWDESLLAAELGALQDLGVDPGLLGFSLEEVDALLAPAPNAGQTDPDDAPESPAAPVTQIGDIWRLGSHRLHCGDATKETDVRALLIGEHPHLMVTDPPYGVDYDPGWRGRAGVGSKDAAIGAVSNDDRADWRDAWKLFPGCVAYIWHGGLHASVVVESLESVGFSLRAQIIWVKTRPVLSRGHYHWQHEPVVYAIAENEKDDHWRFLPSHEEMFYSVRDRETGHWNGDRKQSTVWFIEHLKSETGHGTQKPIECMRRPIVNNSAPGDVIYDPFLGSGTTLIAAEMEGRICYGLEIDPPYCDVIVQRWQDFTGKAARLEATDNTFAETAGARGREAA